MEAERDTIEIMGKQFLKCQQEACEWNFGWLDGLNWTEKPGSGIRICNLGAKAMLEKNTPPPDDCQQWRSVLELARAEFLI
jgi:hypothetical protein